MLRNQHKRFDGPDGRWAEVNGAADRWLVTFSGDSGTLEYETPATARRVAEDWATLGLYPGAARTMVVPAGAFR